MSNLSFQGIGSGMPVQQMIDAIMAAKQQPMQRVEAKIKQYDTRISDMGKLSTLIANFRSSLDPFRVLKDAFKEQFSVSNSNEDLISVTKKPGAANKESTAVFKLLDITNPTAEKNWSWSTKKVVADFKYKGEMRMNFGSGDVVVNFNDKASGYTLDEMVEKINTDANLNTKLEAKKVLINQHTDPSKNTYALRIESKVGGNNGILNNPTFTTNQVQNAGSSTGAGDVTITGGTKTATDLNAKYPSFEVDLSGRTNSKYLTVFYDKDKDGDVKDPIGSSGDEKEVLLNTDPNGDLVGFVGDHGKFRIDLVGDDKLRVTLQHWNDDELKDTTKTVVDPVVIVSDGQANGKNGSTKAGGLVPHPKSKVGVIEARRSDIYIGDGSTPATSSNMAQPHLKDRWTSSAIGVNEHINTDTKMTIAGQDFDMKGKTLQQVADSINNSSLSVKLEAKVDTTSGQSKLVVTSKVAGAAGVLDISVTTKPSNDPSEQQPVNDLVLNAGASNLTDLDQKDLQIRFSVDGQEYTRNTYSLDTSKIPGLEGVEVTIKPNAGNVANKEATIVTTRDQAETKKHTKEAFQGLIDSYNKIIEFVNTQTQVEKKDDGKYAGSLQGDSTLRSIVSSLDTEFANATGGDLGLSLASLGIMHVKPKEGYSFGKLDKDSGKLEIKDEIFEKALSDGKLEKAMSGYTKADGTEVKGYADRFNKLTGWMLNGTGSSLDDFTGLINMRTKTLERQKTEAKDKVVNMKRNLDEMRRRLVEQFRLADSIAAKMSSINNALSKQLGNSSLISSAMGG